VTTWLAPMLVFTAEEAWLVVTGELEKARTAGTIGSSLQAAPSLAAPEADRALLDEAGWAETCITSGFTVADAEAPVASFAPRPRHQMRPLLACPAGGRPLRRPSHPLPPLRGRRGGDRRMSLRLGLPVAAGILIADQASKWWILDVAPPP
jgi:hypothetical protein